eukprot:gene6603-13368_t
MPPAEMVCENFFEAIFRNSHLIFDTFLDIEGYSLDACATILGIKSSIHERQLHPATIRLNEENRVTQILTHGMNATDPSGNRSKGLPTLPLEIYNFKFLMVLNLNYRGIGGNLSEQLGSLKSLVRLQLAHNFIEGPIPSSICELTSLQHLDLTDNRITGTIPTNIGQLTSLRMLYLSDNKLNGQIPSTITLLKDLLRLAMDNNNLSGHIPSNLSTFKQLQLISLNGNKLTDTHVSPIHDVILPPDLKWLYVNNNNFTETVVLNLDGFYAFKSPPK